MHELSIALSLIEAVCEELPRLGDRVRVCAIHVRIGPLSGVAAEALRFSFDVAAAGTAIEGARLEIQPVAIRGRCNRCDTDFNLMASGVPTCSSCGGLALLVTSGRELELTAVEVIDDCTNR